MNADGSLSSLIHGVEEPYNLPRQQLPESYSMTGDIEVARRKTLLEGSVSGDKIFPIVINLEDKIDIDHINDLRAAEDKLKNL